MSRTDRPDIINLAPAGSYFGALGTEIRAAVFPESRQMSPVARDEMNQALAEIAANDPHSGRAPKTAAAPRRSTTGRPLRRLWPRPCPPAPPRATSLFARAGFP